MDLDAILLGIVFTLMFGTAVTITTSGVSTAEFWFARVCYVVAALSLLVYYGRWLSASFQDPKATNVRRAGIGTLVLLLSVGGLATGITWVGWRESNAAAQTQSQSQLTAQAQRYKEAVLQLSKFHTEAMDLSSAQVEKDQVPLWNEKQEELANDAAIWVEKNLGMKAKTRLLDMTGFMANNYTYVSDPDRRDRLIWLDKFARNVRALMQEEATAAGSSH